tara:strand:+ start:1293 stop:1466 length:174 start_codon:yes stop_codon:yes gene_type:complete
MPEITADDIDLLSCKCCNEKKLFCTGFLMDGGLVLKCRACLAVFNERVNNRIERGKL